MKHSQVPDRMTEVRDQHEFDEVVSTRGRVVLQWLAGLGILAAFMMSMAALVKSGQRAEVISSASSQPAQSKQGGEGLSAASVAAAKVVSLSVVPDSKRGPDGKKHDTFTKTEFTLKAGQPLKLRVDNTDDQPHSITAPAVGVNITTMPGTHEYVLYVTKPGRFQWYCEFPCDSDANGWAMKNPGYMSGYITAS